MMNRDVGLEPSSLLTKTILMLYLPSAEVCNLRRINEQLFSALSQFDSAASLIARRADSSKTLASTGQCETSKQCVVLSTSP